MHDNLPLTLTMFTDTDFIPVELMLKLDDRAYDGCLSEDDKDDRSAEDSANALRAHWTMEVRIILYACLLRAARSMRFGSLWVIFERAAALALLTAPARATSY